MKWLFSSSPSFPPISLPHLVFYLAFIWSPTVFGKVFCLSLGCRNKKPYRLGSLSNNTFFFFFPLRSPRSRCQEILGMVRSLFLLLQMATFLLCSLMAERGNTSVCFSPYKDINLIMRSPSQGPHLNLFASQSTMALEIRVSTNEFHWDANTQFSAPSFIWTRSGSTFLLHLGFNQVPVMKLCGFIFLSSTSL